MSFHSSRLSLATGIMREAERRGYRGEGAISFPIQNAKGTGAASIIVSKEKLPNMPEGTVQFVSGERKFYQMKPGENGGSPSWAEVDSSDVNEVIRDLPATLPVPLPPLPTPPDPNAPDLSMIHPVTVEENAPAPQQMRGSDGKLNVGEGNSAENMVVAENGEAAIAVAGRYYGAGPDLQSANRVYRINAGASPHSEKDWSWVFALALTNKTNGDQLFDLYDFKLSVTNVENGRHLDFVNRIDPNTGEVQVYDSRNDIRIDDSELGDGDVLLNIQRVSHYVKALNPTLSYANKVPVGLYNFKATLTRKKGGVPPIVAEFSVDAEDLDLSMIVPQVTTIGQKPSDVALTAQGTLRIGTGNPSTHLIVANNGEVELFGGARFYRTAEGWSNPDSSHKYALNVADSVFSKKDWTWVYSAALLNTKNSLSLDELYEVKLHVRNLDNGKALEFTGRWDGTLYHFEDAANGLDINDNAVERTGRFMQNIQRIEFYKAQLTPELGENTGAPIGNYEFELVATRREGDVPPIVLKYSAEVIDYIPPPPAPEPEPEPEPVADEAPAELSEDEQIAQMLAEDEAAKAADSEPKSDE